MKHNVKLSLQEEVKKDAGKIEKEITENPELEDMKVSEKMENELFFRIMKYKTDKEHHNYFNVSNKENKDRIIHMPHKKHPFVALVAVVVLVAGIGVTSVGSKSYMKTFLNKFIGNEDTQTINVKDMDKQNTEDGEEVYAYAEIKRELGIVPVRFGYMPENMEFDHININKEQKSALLFYKYNDQIIRYMVYLNNADSSLGQKKEDERRDKFSVETDIQTFIVEEYKVKESKENRFITNFSYKSVNYQLKGVMDKENFCEILENFIYFD